MSRRTLGALAGALTLALLGALTPASWAVAAPRPTPGSFTGFAFDTRCAPSNAEMDAWRTGSPFWGVGIYIGGSNRQCQDQTNLDAAWVRRQSRRGWRVLPIWVGPQASCAQREYASAVSPAPAGGYRAARRAGRRQAFHAVQAARALDIPAGSTLWYDMEDYPLADDDCRRSVLNFLSSWSRRLHQLGFASGVYANVAAAIASIDFADKVSPSAYVEPDQVWYAWDNGRADTWIRRSWVRPSSWSPHRRIHQFRLDRSATYGGVTLSIDRSFMDVGRGSVAPSPRRTCGVRVDFARYRLLTRGTRSGQVKAAQCLLRQHGFDVGRITGRFTRPTVRATGEFQRSRHLQVSGTMTATTWTALLSAGPSPVLKQGSASDAVRRVQRALNAATGARLDVTGIFDRATTAAVSDYQKSLGLPATGVVASDTWAEFQSGAR
ncbi:MAG TPA: glycoside hydrolase domain-containing protein [Nocardioidaceae bacterium]|nr:glycoside hydrolase domain-containing protein [Nocardioidaceae bacterium]